MGVGKVWRKLRSLRLSGKVLIGLGVLAVVCVALFITVNGWLYYDMEYREPMRQQQASEAMEIYPGAELIKETDFRDDANYAVQSYFYVTDSPLDVVTSYYVESGVENVIFEGKTLGYLQTYNDLDHIIPYGGSDITQTHEGACGRRVYAECLSTIVLDLDDPAGATLIIISYWITFL